MTERSGRENRGNTKDRAARRANLLRHWGNGATAACVWCDRILIDHGADAASGDRPVDHITADHIVCHNAGGSYRMTNLVPACYPCNNRRDEMPFEEFAALTGRDAEALRRHAESYRRQGRRTA